MFGGRFFGARHFGRRYFGKAGLTSTGYYNGGRYFGRAYFGRRYFGVQPASAVTFSVAATNTLALTGSPTIGSATMVYGADMAVTQVGTMALTGVISPNASLSFDNDTDFAVTPPLEVGALTGTVLVSGSIVISAPAPGFGQYWGGRYFGKRYFGGRYFGSPPGFTIAQTTGISLSGTVGVAGDVDTQLAIAPSTMSLAGTIGLGAATMEYGGASVAPPPPPSGGGGGRGNGNNTGNGRRLNPPTINRQHQSIAQALVMMVAAGVFD